MNLLFILLILIQLINVNGNNNSLWSTMKTITFRLSSGMDLKDSILNFIKENKLQAATVISCIGSLSAANIRLAGTSTTNGNFYLNLTENFEITSLSGTGESKINCNNNISSYGHFHINIAFENGTVIGGHLMKGCIIRTTAEITITEAIDLTFKREYDDSTGYDELSVYYRNDISIIESCQKNEMN